MKKKPNKGYLAVIKKYPNWHSIAGKATQRKHPTLSSERMKRTHIKLKKENPEAYRLMQIAKAKKGCRLGYKKVMEKYPNWHDDFKEAKIRGGKKSAIKLQEWKNKERIKNPNYSHSWSSKGGKKSITKLNEWKKNNPNHGLLGMEAHRKNKPYYWKGVAFDSKAEMEVAKLILKKPISNVNCHVKIKSSSIDFFPQQKVFIEYHPYMFSRKSFKDYKKERWEKIGRSKYKGKKVEFIFNCFHGKKNKVLKQIKKIKKRYNLL